MSEHRKFRSQHSKPASRWTPSSPRRGASQRCPSRTGKPEGSEWLSITQELPQEEGFVLIYVDVPCQNGVVMAFWDGRSFWEHNWPWTRNDVTHWMPLPAAPAGLRKKPTHAESMAIYPHAPKLQEPVAVGMRAEPKTKNAGLWMRRACILLVVWTLALLSWSPVVNIGTDVSHFGIVRAKSCLQYLSASLRT